jgi:hypothetical protein
MFIFKQLFASFKACCSIALSANTMFFTTKTKHLKNVNNNRTLPRHYLPQNCTAFASEKKQYKLGCFLSFWFQDLTFLALIFPGTNNKNGTECYKFAYLHPEACTIKLFHTRAQCYKTFYTRM